MQVKVYTAGQAITLCGNISVSNTGTGFASQSPSEEAAAV